MKSNKILYSSILMGASLVTVVPLSFVISCSANTNQEEIENSQVLAKIPRNIDLKTLDQTLQDSFKTVIAMNVLTQNEQLKEIFKKYTPELLTFELNKFDNETGVADLKVIYKNLSKIVTLSNGFRLITASQNKDLTKTISIKLNPKNDQTIQDAINKVNISFRADIASTSTEVQKTLLAAKIITSETDSTILPGFIEVDTEGGKFIWKDTFSPLYNRLGGMSLTVELHNVDGAIGTRTIEVLGFKGVSTQAQLDEFNKINQTFIVPAAFKDKIESITDKEIISFVDLLSSPLLKDYSISVPTSSIKPNLNTKVIEAQVILMNGATAIDVKPIVITGFN
ncbi:MAG: hypothetical protein ACRC9U_01570 [Metamycoplasmataceae bacterium]